MDIFKSTMGVFPRRKITSCSALVMAVILQCVQSNSAAAQSVFALDSRPKILAEDENHVDLRTGKIGDYAFSLSVGSIQSPALEVVIRRRAGSGAKSGTPMFGKITGVTCLDYSMAGWCNNYRLVEFGSYSEWFYNSSGGYPFKNLYGETYLMRDGVAVVTLRDGTEILFDPAKSLPPAQTDPTYELGRMIEIRKPDGDGYVYSDFQNYIPTTAISNRSYGLWNGKLINLSKVYCSSSWACGSGIESSAAFSGSASGTTFTSTDARGNSASMQSTISGNSITYNAVDRDGRPYQFIETLFTGYYYTTPISYLAVTSFTRDGKTTLYSYTFEWDLQYGGRITTASATYPDGQTRTLRMPDNLSVFSKRGNGPETEIRFLPTIGRYDDATRPSSDYSYVRYPEGDRVDYSYDSRRNLTLVTQTNKSGTATIFQRAHYPEACDNLKFCNKPDYTIDQNGKKFEYKYSSEHGGITEEKYPADSLGNVLIKTYTYTSVKSKRKNAAGGMVDGAPLWVLSSSSECNSDPSCKGSANEILTQYTYDDNLNVVSTAVRSGSGAVLSVVSRSYEASGDIAEIDGPKPGADDVTKMFYDKNRNLTGEIRPAASIGSSYSAKKSVYSGEDRPTLVQEGMVTTATAAALSAITVSMELGLRYDDSGRMTKRMISGIGGISSVSEASYNALGQIVCASQRMNPALYPNLPTDPCTLGQQGTGANDFGPDRITKNEYDAAGQLVQVRRGVGTPLEQAYATYSYTANGNKEYVVDANGNRAQMVYDGFDRLSRWIFPSKTAPEIYAPVNQADALEQAGAVNTADYEEYTYDANGNRLTLRKRDGSTLSFEYDGLNRLTKKLVPERSGLSGAATRDVYYAYDLQGHQTDARFDSLTGEGLHATFDGLGREVSNILTMDNMGRAVSYQYDANSNRTMATQPDGAFARYAYDGLDRLKQAWWGWAGLTDEQQFVTVSYKSNGLRDTIARGMSSTAYGYDNAQRLSSLSQNFFSGTGNLAQTFAYNPAGQMMEEIVSNNAYTYKARVNVNRAYGVNGLNQYSSIAGRSFCYDANGSLTADGTFVYLYDVENRLVEKRAQTNNDCSALAYTGSLKASLRYDPMGRLYETVGDVTGTTRMAYDGDKLIGEYNAGGSLLRRYLWGDRTDEPLVWDEGGLLNCSGTRFLAGNHQGSIVATADCQGNLTRTFAYDEYGIPEAGDATPLTPANGARFLYTGQAFQPDLGMYYYKARMYSPTLGRFMQTDPIGYDDQINLYAYVGNDPVNRTDPAGKYQCLGNASQCNNYEKLVRLEEKSLSSERLSNSERRDLKENIDFIRNDPRYFVAFDDYDRMKSEGHNSGAYTDVEAGAIVSIYADNFSEHYNGHEKGNPNFNAENARAGVVGHEGEHGRQFGNGMTKEQYGSNPRKFEREANKIEQSVTKGLGTMPKCKIGSGGCAY